MPRDLRVFINQTFSSTNVPRVDFQVHTNWTHGADTVAAMYAGAVAEGLQNICFTEHASERSDEWFTSFVAEVRALPEAPCRALVGAETRVIDRAGNLGASEAIRAQCDLVLGSVHRFPDGQGGALPFESVSREEAEQLEYMYAMALLDNPAVDVLAHPFGMCYRRYEIVPSEAHLRAVMRRAAETGTAFEINAYYHPDPWMLITWCREEGATISLGSDAHQRDEIGAIVTLLTGKKFVWNRYES